MVTLIEALILAVVQGLTEWLPVSSSGHLVIIQKCLGIDAPLIFDVILHVGTLMAVLVVFRKDIVNIGKAVAKHDFETEEGKLAIFIVVGSVPIAVIGFLFHDFIESLFSNILVVGVTLIITGSVLFCSERRIGKRKMDVSDSLLVGLAQGAALIPGISRSGITVSTGLLRKIAKANAFRYSFLLSVPAVLGATVIESIDIVLENIDIALLLLGATISMLIGYISLKILHRIVMREKFHLFSYYCWVVGIAIIFFVILQ